MAETTNTPNKPLIESYIETEKAKIKVEPYEKAVVNNAFKFRTFGYWAGTSMGVGWGVIVGVVVAAALPLLSIPLTVGIVAQTITMFAAIGGVAGQLSGQIIGAAAGAAAAAAKERERRDKAEELEKNIRYNPPEPDIMQAKISDHQEKQAALERDNKAETRTVQDIYKQTGGNLFETTKRLVNRNSILLAIGLGSVMGVLLVLGGQTNVAGVLMGEVFGKEAAIKMAAIGVTKLATFGAALGAVSGASFGFAFPAMFTSLTLAAQKMFNGTLFGQDKQPELAPEIAPQKAVPEMVPAYSQTSEHRFTTTVIARSGSFAEAACAKCEDAGKTLSI